MWDNIKLLWKEFVDYLYAIMLTVFDFVKDTFFWCMDQLMTGAIALTDGLGESLSALNPAEYIAAIPPDTRGMMAVCGFNECMSIIVTALTIRIIIQLIPFIRWGS